MLCNTLRLACLTSLHLACSMQVGRQEPVMVLRVDNDKGYIDLSKRYAGPFPGHSVCASSRQSLGLCQTATLLFHLVIQPLQVECKAECAPAATDSEQKQLD